MAPARRTCLKCILAALAKKKEGPQKLAYFSWPKFRERIEQALNSAISKGTESA